MSGPFALRAAPWALMAFVAVSVVMARTEPLQSLGFAALIAAVERAGYEARDADEPAAGPGAHGSAAISLRNRV